MKPTMTWEMVRWGYPGMVANFPTRETAELAAKRALEEKRIIGFRVVNHKPGRQGQERGVIKATAYYDPATLHFH